MTDATTPKIIAPPEPEAPDHAVARPGKTTHAVVRIRELDALRGIAALLVVLFHFTMFRPQAEYGFKYGVTGVDLFFMISGYVIFLTINRVRDWRDFIVSRVARLYPAYWTAVLLTTLLLYVFDRPHFFPKATLANLTMLQNFVGTGDLDGAYWTLAVELIFYGLMLLLFVSGQLRTVESWGAVFLSILLGFHLAGPVYFSADYNLMKEYLPFVSHAPLFVSGILFYNLQHRPANWLRHAAIGGCFVFTCYLHDKGGTAMGSISAREHYLILAVYVAIFYLFIGSKLAFLVNRYT
ncbi:MAG: acyltransferase, partial [Bacteroidetes bacterium]|nr:acyltransferase [Fibrella sp.]